MINDFKQEFQFKVMFNDGVLYELHLWYDGLDCGAYLENVEEAIRDNLDQYTAEYFGCASKGWQMAWGKAEETSFHQYTIIHVESKPTVFPSKEKRPFSVPKNPLLDKTITEVFIAKDKMAMKFIVSEEVEVLCEDDGGCSATWIEHVLFPVLGLPANVTAVEDVPLRNWSYGQDGHELKKYGCRIVTDKGDLFFEYRNESNGYYGGEICWEPEESFCESKKEWVKLKEWI